jgi:hypothetical protein
MLAIRGRSIAARDATSAAVESGMNGSAVDQQLLQIVSGSDVASISDVVAKLQAIEGVLPGNDGLKWFNLLYLKVTQQVDLQPPAGGWQDAAWLVRLDVVFAGLYLAALKNWIERSPNVPSSWQALFEARFAAGIDRIQFALAGMNAHINHDLALALLQTDAEMNLTPGLSSPERADFERVNGILEVVLPQALTFLAADVLGEAAQDTGKIGRLLAIWSVGAARDFAWNLADALRPMIPDVRSATMALQDQTTGVLGRTLLLPMP